MNRVDQATMNPISRSIEPGSVKLMGMRLNSKGNITTAFNIAAE